METWCNNISSDILSNKPSVPNMITSPSSTANDELSAISGLKNQVIKVENCVHVNVCCDYQRYWEKKIAYSLVETLEYWMLCHKGDNSILKYSAWTDFSWSRLKMFRNLNQEC